MTRYRKIGDVGVYCKNIEKMKEFYTEILSFKRTDVNDHGFAFLRFGTDHHSLLLCRAGQPAPNYDFDTHDPEGNFVQFYAEMDQIGWDGKSRPKELRREFAVEDE
jgi:catechol-2,3-dioxygenase